jgi:hypothetical protein
VLSGAVGNTLVDPNRERPPSQQIRSPNAFCQGQLVSAYLRLEALGP